MIWGESMKKPANRRERIEFICRKKGNRASDIFTLMTDREVKTYFEYIYPAIKNKPDVTNDYETIQCIRCGCDVEHHFECACGYDRAVFSEEDWRRDIEDNDDSDLNESDKEFISNGYRINKNSI